MYKNHSNDGIYATFMSIRTHTHTHLYIRTDNYVYESKKTDKYIWILFSTVYLCVYEEVSGQRYGKHLEEMIDKMVSFNCPLPPTKKDHFEQIWF